MHQNRFIAFGRRHLKGWGINLLIAMCLTYVIFVIMTPKEEDQGQRTSVPPYHVELKYSLHLISPAQLGITEWQIGDYAEYEYRKPVYPSISEASPAASHFGTKKVAFHVIEELTTAAVQRYWLKITGMLAFRDVQGDIYQLAYPEDIRPTPENRRYGFLDNYVPAKFGHHNLDTVPLAKLVQLNPEEIQTPAGRFKCMYYRVDLGEDMPLHEIWVNTEVRPFGIVRMRSGRESLELIAFGQNTDYTVPQLFQPVIEGVSILDRGCTSCHGSNSCHESIFPPK